MSKNLTLQQKIDKVNQKLANEGFDGQLLIQRFLGVQYFGALGELCISTKTGGYLTHQIAYSSWSQKALYKLAKEAVA